MASRRGVIPPGRLGTGCGNHSNSFAKVVTPPGLENNLDDASHHDDSSFSVENTGSLAHPRDVSRTVAVPSLGTVEAAALALIEEAIRDGDTARALELTRFL